MSTPIEININFSPINATIHHEEESILITALSGTGSVFKKKLTEEQIEQLVANLEEAFEFLAEDGDVDINIGYF